MLAELRAEIDAVSIELVRVLGRRFELSLAIGADKRALGLPLHDPLREDELIERLVRTRSGAIPEDALRRILRVILDESLAAMRHQDKE